MSPERAPGSVRPALSNWQGRRKVALFGRRAGPIEETAAECSRYTPGAIAISVDVSDKDSVEKAVDMVKNQFGRLDVLINNAGMNRRTRSAKLPSTPISIWSRTNTCCFTVFTRWGIT